MTAPRRTSPTREVEDVADQLHSAALHLLRRLRTEDDALGVSPPRLSALSVVVFAGPIGIGALAAAEGVALRALELEPRDVRAHHVVSHVLEMQGRAAEGVLWMGARSAWWADPGAASTHLWWHLALYQLELGRTRLALEVYDRRLQGDSLSELIDASALLWRLHLAGHDGGGRFAALAARWEPYAEDAHCAFNDLHAMMAFAGAGRWDWAGRVLAAQSRRIGQPWSTNHDMTSLVGLPASRAILAFGKKDYAGAEALLRALPPVAHRIGGSHAQRDILQLTRAAAAQRRPRLVA